MTCSLPYQGDYILIIMRFDEILYNDALLDALEVMHFDECTPIQEKSIPVIEAGRDLIALAQTGTGKTAAYLLPVLDLLADGGFPEDAVNCVIMAPTRELAMQIDQQMEGFGYFLPEISSMAIYGGTGGNTFDKQKTAIQMGANLIIATPGRLLAHMQMGYVDLSRVSFFILDEADRMLDMGFFDDIMKVITCLPDDVQTLMFSATLSPKIKKLVERLLHDPVEVKIALAAPPDRIDQKAYIVYERQKEAMLRHILRGIDIDRIIVFSSSKIKTKELARTLRSWHIKAGEIHSDLDQEQRQQTMLDFRAGRINVLVATDIVARGIDIDDISTIINFDVPHEAEDYVHRIGRTARAQATGRAITLIGEKEREKFRRIERLINKEVEKGEVPADLGATPSPGSGSPRNDGRGKSRGRSDKPRRSRSKSSSKPQSATTTPAAESPLPPQSSPAAGTTKKKRRHRHHKPKKASLPAASDSDKA